MRSPSVRPVGRERPCLALALPVTLLVLVGPFVLPRFGLPGGPPALPPLSSEPLCPLSGTGEPCRACLLGLAHREKLCAAARKNLLSQNFRLTKLKRRKTRNFAKFFRCAGRCVSVGCAPAAPGRGSLRPCRCAVRPAAACRVSRSWGFSPLASCPPALPCLRSLGAVLVLSPPAAPFVLPLPLVQVRRLVLPFGVLRGRRDAPPLIKAANEATQKPAHYTSQNYPHNKPTSFLLDMGLLPMPAIIGLFSRILADYVPTSGPLMRLPLRK